MAEKHRGRLFVISGPSGAGKSSVVKGLRQRRRFYFSVSATTRAPRPGEEHGVHYWFIAPLEFDKLIDGGDLLEWAEYNDRRYGTLRAPVLERLGHGEDVILEIEVQGARQVKESYPDAIMFFVVPPSIEDLEARLRRRADTPDQEIARRLLIARHEIAEARGVFDYVVTNDDLERCIAEVDELMSAIE
ncbi:MAG: guanylate kinase [Acidimicrobiia bacterium]